MAYKVLTSCKKKASLKEQSEIDETNSAGSQENDASAAFEKLVRENIGWMLSLANGLLRDAAKAEDVVQSAFANIHNCLLYTSPSPRDATLSRMPSSA